MTCQWIVAHRLKNLKPPKRYEPCSKPAGLRKLEGHPNPQRIWLCRYHWKLLMKPKGRNSRGEDLLGILPDTTDKLISAGDAAGVD